MVRFAVVKIVQSDYGWDDVETVETWDNPEKALSRAGELNEENRVFVHI